MRSSIASSKDTSEIKEAITGTLDLEYTSAQTSASVTFDHNLNLIPIVKVYQLDPLEPTSQNRVPYYAVFPPDGTIEFGIDSYVTRTQLVITARMYKGSTFGVDGSYLLTFVMITP